MEVSVLSNRRSGARAAVRLSYLGISVICRRFFASSIARSDVKEGSFDRSDFSGHGYTGFYEPGPTEGPLKDASNIGVPRITPRSLKSHLDQFVVGQERAKKILSVAVYNHYQRIQELERQEEEMEEVIAQQVRRDRAKERTYPLEDEFPGQQRTVTSWDPNAPTRSPPTPPPLGSAPIIDASPTAIEKSNIMLLGPSGVGKTLMAKTLARVLEVPFSMSDCTPFTQAGYIGEDADVCVQRLLAAANYDVAKAERGIICLDEIDKIATARVSHGKDVSGEGVQQAMLKIIEGTTLHIQAKSDRNAGGQGRSNRHPDTGSPLSGSTGTGSASGNKAETYTVRTDNILFICTGAFIGLHRHILDRISRGSIGFDAPVRASPSASATSPNDPLVSDIDPALFRQHLPFYATPPSNPTKTAEQFNSLDLVTPSDLQKFGLIPELVGRVPITCALSPLSIPMLVQVLTEPRNSLVRQYEQLFALSSIELRFTTPALHAMAEQAHEMGTGARGLRTVMERVLGDTMYECPGSGVRHVAVTADVVRREREAWCFTREDGRQGFSSVLQREEDEWEEKRACEERGRELEERGTFEEYRARAGAVGYG